MYIDRNGNPRLADFGLLSILSDPTVPIQPISGGNSGTVRFMSPELIIPEKFGLRRSLLTKASDCYAFGMAVYETISGYVPFYETRHMGVFLKVVEGESPRRVHGFADNLWEMLELCWATQPSARPSIKDVLQCLEGISNPREPQPSPSLPVDEEMLDGSNDWVDGRFFWCPLFSANLQSSPFLIFLVAIDFPTNGKISTPYGCQGGSDPAANRRAAIPPSRSSADAVVLSKDARSFMIGYGFMFLFSHNLPLVPRVWKSDQITVWREHQNLPRGDSAISGIHYRTKLVRSQIACEHSIICTNACKDTETVRSSESKQPIHSSLFTGTNQIRRGSRSANS